MAVLSVAVSERPGGRHTGAVAVAFPGGEGADDRYRWMTCVAAAQRLGVSLRWLYRAIDRGDLPGYRIDGQIRLLRHEVEQFRACRAFPGDRPA